MNIFLFFQNAPSASFSSVLESPFCRRHLHSYLQSLQATQDGEDSDTPPVTSSGVAALGLYWALQELLAAPARDHEAIREQIFYSYISDTCSYPVPIDETQKQVIWQLVLKGSCKAASGSNCPPLIGWLAGAVEEVGQFLQTRYSTGFLHSPQYRVMMQQATAIGHHIASGVNTQPEGCPKVSCNGSPSVTLQNQLHHAHTSMALLQERKLYKSWAAASLATANPTVSEECLRDVMDTEANLRHYQSHLRYLQLWIDNLGKWRVHVQGVDCKEERDNPDIVLLVSLDLESPSTLKSFTSSPQPPASPQPQNNLNNSANSSSINTLAPNNLFSVASDSGLLDQPSPNSSDIESDPTTQSVGEGLKAIKSKSLSFERDFSVVGKAPSFEKTSSSLDKISYAGGRGKIPLDKQQVPKGTNVSDKSFDSLKSKSSQGSLEKLFGSNFSKSCCSYPDISSSFASALDGNETLDQNFEGGIDSGEGWIVVRKLSHFAELHKKLR